MRRTSPNPLRRIAGDARGNVAILLALMLIPLAAAVGAGIDYGRAVQIRATLQNAVDAAALSGASAYISPSAQSTAHALAQGYLAKGTAALPTNVTVNSTTVTPGSTGSAYTMYVSATVTVPTTFLAFYKKSLAVTAWAKATNPVVTASFNAGSFVSYACDINEIYWYIVPSNGGVPDASAMTLLWSNDATTPTTAATFKVAASAQIGFAMKNITGARDPSLGGCNYGNNGYGSQPGDVQWLYSSLQPPSASFNIAPGGANTGSHGVYPTNQDCALAVVEGTMRYGTMTFPSVPQGECFTASGSGGNSYGAGNSGHGSHGGNGNGNSSQTMLQAMTAAAPSCQQLGGNTYQYDWNDMGGTTDTFNYGNDMQYSFSCSGGSGSGNGTTTAGVVLIN